MAGMRSRVRLEVRGLRSGADGSVEERDKKLAALAVKDGQGHVLETGFAARPLSPQGIEVSALGGARMHLDISWSAGEESCLPGHLPSH